MSEAESKRLRVGDRVYWDDDPADIGSVVETDYLCVRIKWENGQEGTIHHRDMSKVHRVK